MDERLPALILLLIAGVLPLRELAGKWAGRPDRRFAAQALWALYLIAAVGAVTALIVISRREDRPRPPPASRPEQYADLPAPARSGISGG